MVKGMGKVQIIILLNIRHGFLLTNEQLFFISRSVLSVVYETGTTGTHLEALTVLTNLGRRNIPATVGNDIRAYVKICISVCVCCWPVCVKNRPSVHCVIVSVY